MLPTRLFQPKGRSRAQALVEFSLTAMLLLLTLTLIIEVARIFQAYVTLQAAARSGARYAVTGQWMPQFAGDLDLTPNTGLDSIKAMRSGWDKNSGDPYKHIAPCWPRFPGFGDSDPDDNLPDVYTTTRWSYDSYEPYRDPRTCSIEHNVIRSMTGLPLDPSHVAITSSRTTPLQAGPICCYTDLYPTLKPPYTYEIQVFGYTNDKYPNDDTYWRPDPNDPTDSWEERSYEHFYAGGASYKGEEFDGEAPGLVLGYGGDPGKKVLVRVKYRLGLITPILSTMVPWIELTGLATMTNESFGSTGVQSNAVLPPPLPSFPAGADPLPPELVIQTISLVTAVPPNPSPNETDFTVNVVAKNQGELGVETDTTLRLYGVKTTQLATPYTAAALTSSGTLFGEVTIPAGTLAQGGTFASDFTFRFPSSGTWYLYAFVDGANTVDEIGSTGDTARENNNISHYGAPTGIIATSDADLEVTKTVSDVAPAQNQVITYKIIVKNLGSATATGVVVTDVLPGGVTCQSSDLPLQYSCATGVWNVGAVTFPGSKILNITARVTAANGSSPIDNTASITGMAPTIFDPESGNNSDTATINVGAINLRMVKRLPSSSPDPIEGSSHPFTYILEVTNLSSATPANGVTITDTLPSGVTFVSATGGCTHSSGVVTCGLGTVAGGATVRRDIVVYANVGTGGQSLTNTATVVAAEPDPDPDNDTSSVTVLVQSVDIRVTKTSNILYAAQNAYFTWTIKVKNLGPDDATGVTVRDVIPTGMLRTGWTITTSTTPNPGSYSTSTSVWTIGNLAENTEETMTIRARTPTSTPNNTIVNNTASLLTSDQTDVNSGNNSDDAPITITDASAADLQMDKTVSPSSANTTTTEVIYTLKVTNNGPQDATGVKMTDASLAGKLSTLFTWLGENSTPTGLTFNKTTGVVSVGNLAAGDSATIRIRVKPVFGVEPIFTNTATATKGSPPDDQDPDNNSDSATLNLEWPALIYVNPGGAGCGNPIEFGSSDDKLAPNDYTWEPTHPISAGTWGHYGSNYQLIDLPPTTQYSFLDDTFVETAPEPMDAVPFGDGSAGQNLMGCAITGSDFSYRFNNLVPGVYDITLVFADPYYGIGKRRFTLVASTNGNSKRLFKNFDISTSIKNTGKAPRVSYNGVTYVRYIIKKYTFRVRDAGWLRLRFSKGTFRTGYSIYKPIVSGIGIRYRGS